MSPRAQTLAKELGLLLLVAVGWMLACEHLLAPRYLQGGATTGSDVGEHFWMLHALGEPGWPNFSLNRYPLPSVLARAACFADSPHRCWRIAAFVSSAFLGGGLYLWARALAGVGAGLAAVILAASLPELVIIERTVSSYPEILALWTVGAALGAVALRWPGATSVAAASAGAGAVFLSDARGLLVGLALLPALAVSAWRAGPRGLVAFLPLALAFGLARSLPVQPRPLEVLLEASIEQSYQRARLSPPPRQNVEHGWVFGQTPPWRIPETFAALQAARGRMNPAAAEVPEQKVARRNRLDPLILPVAVLSLGAVASWRRALALLPAGPMLALLYNTWHFEYYERYAALGMSACALLMGVGLAGWTGWTRRGWIAALLALILLFAPTPLALTSWWRSPIGAQGELQDCVAGVPNPRVAVDECLAAQSRPLRGWLASPWQPRGPP